MFRIKGRVPRKALAWGLPTAWGAMAISYKLACPLAQEDSLGARVVTSAVFFAVGTGLIVHVRQALLRELRQVRKVAGAAQSALLRPLPSRVDGLNVAAAQLSADRSACVGGDLYEVIATEHGVRAVMGDVRGHGIAALGTVAAVLGSFREAVHDEPGLDGVLRRLDRALARYLSERACDEEEFVTVLLLEFGRDGEIIALNCGHPWPYVVSDRGVESLTGAEPLPPLGLFPLPTELTPLPCGRLRAGDSLVLYTDGIEDARDVRGRFFPLQAALIDAVRLHPITPQTILRTLFTALIRHTGGRQADDIALLVLRNDRTPVQCTPLGARGCDIGGSAAGARPATTNPQPSNHL
ncbi:PP2C family protein-serine/threonine phosphatase [Streptomyces muensis]|uniref:Serine/threonine-protein phosphatase n=1 Tax=Streptomyces muensis TaxID=1077944 RepID=A0A9X1PVR5_STRM4|nr:PP2C family protein-serine/threonine phosphatase [Streptomyces muensis]MCF1594422.1 serine/threonine-protein phosphatase [Streptomyces muensis]